MIYIHIPFCRQKCSYCNFHFSTSLKYKDAMVDALKKEIQLRNHELTGRVLPSLYFGGGTPSVLQVYELQGIIDEILTYFSFESDIEITLEANPDDLNRDFLKNLRNSPFNRLSIGTQSFAEADLLMMNRAHTAGQAEDSIKRAQDFGFENISIDLIYGSPTSDSEIWKQNLSKAIGLEIPHISSYALTVEPKTALNAWVHQGKIKAPDDAVQHEDFFYMTDFLKSNGFDHYEISNFGKPGYHSRHNTAYWQHREYLGIGPSAHTFNGSTERSWNIANNPQYMAAVGSGAPAVGREILSENDQFNEMLMIGLRTSTGVDISMMEQKFSYGLMQYFRQRLKNKIETGQLITEGQYLRITESKWFYADGIAADLFKID